MEEAANDEPSGLALSPQNQWLSVLRDAAPADSLVTAKAVTPKLHFTITTGPAVETQGWSQRAIASRLETYGIDWWKSRQSAIGSASRHTTRSGSKRLR